ncbi:MAG: type II pantothenate kinase [Clostridia bacterium]|nr:type II pantothenate kinase [Clostridia bacterium]MBQ5649660.1 type II pantothenate kinase [Clostridia bacterium]MBQ5808472.1 type II pantothenate kinase [Clostridia bacterium]
MGINIGIDIGGSTTKIVAIDKTGEEMKLFEPLFVRAADPITSLYGAFGKFTVTNGLELSDISKVMVTGIGSSCLKAPIYSLPCTHVTEFESIGLGGLYLSGLDRCITVSMGTGTAIVYAQRGKPSEYLGGTGVGGGTLQGLSKLLLGMDDVSHIHELAKDGDIHNIDLSVNGLSSISSKESYPGMSMDITASNFGNVSDIAEKADVAKGVFNMVFETIAMVAIFAARSKNTKDIVLTGNLTAFGICKDTFEQLEKIFGVNFIIPDNSQFATVIGAALQA